MFYRAKCPFCGAPKVLYGYCKYMRCEYCGGLFSAKYPAQIKQSLIDLYNTKTGLRYDCPVCRGDGTMFKLGRNKTTWKCVACDYENPRRDTDDILWFCDDCDAFLNIQPGFTEKYTKYICKECGFVNDLTKLYPR